MSNLEEGFWIFNTSSKDCKPLSDEELQELKKTKEEFYKNYKPSSNPEDIISNLDRYSNEYGYITKSLNGEYVLFDDVIKAVSILFSREKE